MSEIKQLNLPKASSLDEQKSATQEVSGDDVTDISAKSKEPAQVINDPVTADDGRSEQQVTDESDITGEAPPTQETDEDSEAQQYERFEYQMIFKVGTPEAKNESLLNALVENTSNINKLCPGGVNKYVAAINSTLRSTMIHTLANRSVNFDRMILVGNACTVLKAIVKSPDQRWEGYIEDKFGKDLLSTIGTYMRLAKIRGVKNHSHLGKDRILKVYSTRKKLNKLPSNSSDPIGDILQQLKIIPIHNISDDFQIFNKRVDAALFAHKIATNGITVNHQSVINLASTKFNFKDSGRHLKAMLYLKDNIDDPRDACQRYLNNILKNNGIYNGSKPKDEYAGSKNGDDLITSLKESYASIRTSFGKGKELSVDEKSEIQTLVNYLNKLIA